MWTECQKCGMKSKQLPMSDRTFYCSFGKYLEMIFYSNPIIPFNSSCKHSIFADHIQYFGWKNMVIQMSSDEKLPSLQCIQQKILK